MEPETGDSGDRRPSATGRDVPVAAATPRAAWLFATATLFGLVIAASVAISADPRIRTRPLWDQDRLSILSALAVGAVAGLWFAGAVQLVRIVTSPAGPVSRMRALLAAFGAGPLMLALFFYPVALAHGFDTLGNAATASLTALAAAVPLMLLRAASAYIAEELFLSLFVWLGLLVMPALTADPVGQQAARLMIRALRWACLLP